MAIIYRVSRSPPFSTNLPKEVMGYPDFTYSQHIRNSYISSKEVLHFLNSYADHFQLRAHIKFQHEVIRLRPNPNVKMSSKWEVITQVQIYDPKALHLPSILEFEMLFCTFVL